jgi:hypothetical protein
VQLALAFVVGVHPFVAVVVGGTPAYVTAADAVAIGTVVTVGAGVAVIAQRHLVGILAADTGSADVVGALLAVVADQLPKSRHTIPAGALVTEGARIAIVTLVVVGSVHAAALDEGVARVVGALVVILADQHVALTLTEGAGVAVSTLITVTARSFIEDV